MPVANSKPSNSMEMVKQDGTGSLDTFIKRAVGKEQPYLSFSRPENGPVQLFQLLNAFDQPEIPGWSFLTPLKVQMKKCDKCSREFCSPINYRRHIRVHRRFRKLDKDAGKDRDLLRAFWDKLSEEEAREIVSFQNVMLEEFPGSSVVMALTTLIHKPGISALPQYYLRAGSDLLDVIQARPSRFPLSSQELFSILDDASERTFLCGTAGSVQKYVFDEETVKNAVEAKNAVACASFLLEQKLIKAWLADKDAEALRCQKLLVEEEEAAQRRQAELLERRRRKKLRQKELRGKDHGNEEKENIKETDSATSDEQHQAESYIPLPSASDSDMQIPDVTPTEDSSLEMVEALRTNEDANHKAHTYSNDEGNGQTTERRGGRRHTVVGRWQASIKPLQGTNGFHTHSGSHVSKLGGIQKIGTVTNRDFKASPSVHTTKVWSRKGEKPNPISKDESVIQPGQSKNGKVLIGSICVTLENSSSCGGNDSNDCTEECELVQSNVNEKSSSEQSTVKLWRQVIKHGRSSNTELETPITENYDGKIRHALSPIGNNVHPGSFKFNSNDAKAFLAQRWKEATSAEHVTLILSPESENSCHKCDILSNTQNQLSGSRSGLESSTGGSAKPKFRTKPEKGVMYIPKQRTVG